MLVKLPIVLRICFVGMWMFSVGFFSPYLHGSFLHSSNIVKCTYGRTLQVMRIKSTRKRHLKQLFITFFNNSTLSILHPARCGTPTYWNKIQKKRWRVQGCRALSYQWKEKKEISIELQVILLVATHKYITFIVHRRENKEEMSQLLKKVLLYTVKKKKNCHSNALTYLKDEIWKCVLFHWLWKFKGEIVWTTQQSSQSFLYEL